jgi:rhamnose transport system substrate-binding protein
MSRMRFIMMVAAAMLAVGCGGDTSSVASTAKTANNSGTKQLKVGMLPKLDIPYFQACRQGAEEACKELGFTFDYNAAPQLSADEQESRVRQWIAQKYDVILIAPNDPESIAPVLAKAKREGVVVVTYDADANPERSGRAAFVNQASVQGIGEGLVDALAEQMGKRGKALIVSSTPTAPNQNAWMAVMKPYLKKKYPEIELLQDLMPGEDQNLCREQTRQVIAATPDLKGIVGLTSKALPGAAEAVKQAGKSGQIAVTGLGLPSEVKEHVNDGTVKKFLLWSPIDLGYLAVHAAKAAKEGKLSDGKHTFGRLKDVAVSNGEVLLGPPMEFTKENVGTATF